VIVAPPLLAGAVKLTTALAVDGETLTDVGEPGATGTGATGVTEAEPLEAALLTAFTVLFTANVYALPFVKPVTVIGETLPVAEMPPGEDVTV
jgi:hypothetical protein